MSPLKPRLAFPILFCLCCNMMWHISYADTNTSYAYTNIAAALLQNANAVIREDSQYVSIIALDKVYSYEKYAVTILNKNGYSNALLREYYDIFSKIDNIQGTLYDKDGNKIRSLKKKDIIDRAIFDDITIYNDNRVKLFDFNYAAYPFTVVFEVEKYQDHSFMLPKWESSNTYQCAVERSTFEVQYPVTVPLRYKAFNITNQPDQYSDNATKTIKFTITNLKAGKKMDMVPDDTLSSPEIILALDTFSFGGMRGKMDSWLAFGNFFYQLNDNRQTLPDAIRNTVHQLTDSCKSAKTKIDILYQYLQANTRYVSIQYGIGGWQTLDAQFVAEKGYGDCKALTNYMMSLLKEAGITSYSTLIYGGAEHAKIPQKDFPYNTFNHVILCIPSIKDTLWLECTSKTLPTGYLSAFTEDRDALVLTPKGGYIAHTPVYTKRDNSMQRNVSLEINDENILTGNATFICKGYFNDQEQEELSGLPKDKVENYINAKLQLPSNKIINYTLKKYLDICIPVTKEQVSFLGAAKVSRTGKRLFIEPSLLSFNIHVPRNQQERAVPFEIKTSYQVIDTQKIVLHGDYILEHVPDPVDIKFPFAEYRQIIEFTNHNEIQVIHYYCQNKGIYAASFFENYITLCKTVNGAIPQVVLLKKD